jgi:hypothetical protein
MNESGSLKWQLAAVYSNYAFWVVFGVGFVAFAGFVPPPAPTAGPEAIAGLLAGNAVVIRAGMCVCVLASALLLPWGAAVGAQLRRMEPEQPWMVYTWITANTILVILFIYPCLWWAVAAFRPGFNPEVVQSINDMAWLGFMGIIPTALIQCIVLAVATFRDNQPTPLFPRWFGYFQVWCCLLLTPDLVVYCFKTGPLAWNGLLAFWVEIFAAFAWNIVTTVMTAKAIKNTSWLPPAGNRSLEARLAALERAQVASR